MHTFLTQKFCLMCNMQVLVLGGNQIGDVGLIAFAKAVEKGALPQLKELNLYKNQIGDVGMQALAGAVSTLADALGKGALAPGAKVYLGRNSVTETGEQAMRDAAKARGLAVYL